MKPGRARVHAQLRMLAREDQRVEVRAGLREAVGLTVAEALCRKGCLVASQREALVDEGAEARPRRRRVEKKACISGLHDATKSGPDAEVTLTMRPAFTSRRGKNDSQTR